MRALIIEDHDVYREMLEQTLATAAMETVALRNAHDLAATTALGQPDLAIVDWWLGNDASGSDAARELRVLNPAIRTILITGYPVEFARSQNAGDGIDAILAKPFSSEMLLETVARVLGPVPTP